MADPTDPVTEPQHENKSRNPGQGRKHPCPDCRMCQWCAEVRCRPCRGQGRDHAAPRLSFAEQIALFEKINAED